MSDSVLKVGFESPQGVAEGGTLDEFRNLKVNISGYGKREFTFHENRTTTGSGAFLGTQNFSGLKVEIVGSSTSRKIEFKGIMFDGAWKGIYGQNVSTGVMNKETTGNNEIWQFDITGLKQIVMVITQVSGGDVTVKGIVSAEQPKFLNVPQPNEDPIHLHEFYLNRTTLGIGSILSTNVSLGYTKAYVHFWGDATTRKIEFKARLEDNLLASVYGYNILDDYKPAKETTGIGRQVWLFEDLQAYRDLRMDITALSGGSVSATARVVKK